MSDVPRTLADELHATLRVGTQGQWALTQPEVIATILASPGLVQLRQLARAANHAVDQFYVGSSAGSALTAMAELVDALDSLDPVVRSWVEGTE